jgi:hypothetical protein
MLPAKGFIDPEGELLVSTREVFVRIAAECATLIREMEMQLAATKRAREKALAEVQRRTQ